ncbi:class I SAM-dependent methyltransferase [Stenomitos frigidus]|uniref:Class I SAM-dependent methyltransferase n=1 Tax=Stenomitos frigidus ULC18 TaxID=2107698 RepID=A0A2T1DZQ8_9CYAN|nr:class I SAM-dependent methyltransferase [Stenomitos frigidus]PSB25980.1 class I SAM-dependent methyltransferase [Stenomitos frigidus ULC18]
MKIYSPLTGSDDVTLLKTIQSEQLVRDWARDFQIDITEELHGNKEIYLYKCNQTQLKFFTPSNIAGSGELYKKLQRTSHYYMPDRWEHKIALKDLSDCQKVIEIGSAWGYFVKSGREIGLEIRGIELNEAAALFAQGQNIPIERLDLREAAILYKESLDAVCSFQVLEHVTNPKDFIDWSLQMLKPGGKLICCVPNSDSFLKYQYNLLDLPPHHMTLWSAGSFKSLESLFPIKLEKTVIEPLAPYHTEGYLSAYRDHLRSKHPTGKVFLNRFTLPVFRKILNAGVSFFLTGQSLYVQFRKI